MGPHRVRTHWMYQYCVLYLACWWFSEPKHVAVIFSFNIDYQYMLCNWLNKLLYYKQFVTKINNKSNTQQVKKEISTGLALKSSKKKCNAVNFGCRRSTKGWEVSVPYTYRDTVKNNNNLKSSHDKISLL